MILSYFRNNENSKIPFAKISLWLFIFAMIIILYAFRFELNFVKDRILAVLIPHYSWTEMPGQITLARQEDGHFYLKATLKDKQQIKFLIDTGASNIALTKEDALKLGFNLSTLKYTQKYSTANGINYAAPVRIDQLTIGDKTFYNVKAHVVYDGLDISLLGMSLIDQFKDFKITKDMLILNY